MPTWRLGPAALLALVVLTGCAGLLSGAEPQGEETLTPAPVSETTAAPTTTVTTPQVPSDAEADATARYASLEPTCARPPGLVIQLQVAALANNDPETNGGIQTAWRFAAPSNREYTGPYSNFERLIESQFSPLLAAETITYGPVETENRSARRSVTVTALNGNSSTYTWRLEKQSGGRYDGCWMTTAVRPAPAG